MRPLRIFYISDTTPNAWCQTVRSNLWRMNLYLPLVDLGHDVVEFQGDLQKTFMNLDSADPRQAAFIAENRPRLSAEILRQVLAAQREKPLDLFFSYLLDACITPATVDAIRALGIRTVNWYCNGSYRLDLVQNIAPHYDWCLVPEKFRLADYRALGARPIYCQEAANPTVYLGHDGPREFDVTFVGQCYGDRPAMLGYLLGQGIDVRVWGFGWPAPQRKWVSPELYAAIAAIPPERRGDALADEELIRMYSRSKINLGFSTCGDTHKAGGRRVVQVRLRDFEIPMAGGFYLVERVEELAEFYEFEKEICTYGSKEELGDKVRFYLKHDAAREQIRLAGQRRARRDHTWHKRFEMALAQMGWA